MNSYYILAISVLVTAGIIAVLKFIKRERIKESFEWFVGLFRSETQEGEEADPERWRKRSKALSSLFVPIAIGAVLLFFWEDLWLKWGFWLGIILLYITGLSRHGWSIMKPTDQTFKWGAIIVLVATIFGTGWINFGDKSTPPKKNNTSVSSKEAGGFLYKCVEVPSKSEGKWSEWLDIPPPEYYTKWGFRFKVEGEEEGFEGVWVKNIKGEVRKLMKDDRNYLGDAVTDPVFRYSSMNEAECKICLYLTRIYASN